MSCALRTGQFCQDHLRAFVTDNGSELRCDSATAINKGQMSVLSVRSVQVSPLITEPKFYRKKTKKLKHSRFFSFSTSDMKLFTNENFQCEFDHRLYIKDELGILKPQH